MSLMHTLERLARTLAAIVPESLAPETASEAAQRAEKLCALVEPEGDRTARIERARASYDALVVRLRGHQDALRAKLEAGEDVSPHFQGLDIDVQPLLRHYLLERKSPAGITAARLVKAITGVEQQDLIYSGRRKQARS